MKTFLKYWKTYGMFALLVILVLFFSLTKPDTFFTTATLMNILKQSAVIGTLSCGVTMYLITGATDISVGGRVAFITCVAAYMAVAGVNVFLIILACIVLGTITGALNAILAESLRTYVFVITIATNSIWYGVTYTMTKGILITGFGDDIKFISQYPVFGIIPSIVFVWLGCTVIAGFILGKTRFGRQIYALGGNREAAFLAGINVKKVNILTHAVGGAFVGIGALILLSRAMSATASTGTSFSFDCITACVLGGVLLGGGRGKIHQAFMGVLVVNVLFNGLTIYGISDFIKQIVQGGVMLFAIALEVLQRYAKVDITDETAGGADAAKVDTAAKKAVGEN